MAENYILEIATIVLSVVAGGFAFFTWWLKAREASFRRADVHVWATEVIASMQTLTLLLRLDQGMMPKERRSELATQVAMDTSILVEKGRMFFKNCLLGDGFGNEKERAYQGYRPLILDPIVVAHQIACRSHRATPEERARLLAVSEDMTRAFVSLIQLEVGRSKSVSADTSTHGNGADLDYLLSRLPPIRRERDCVAPH